MLTLTALGLVIAAIMPGTNRWNKRFFIFLFATTMLLMATALFELLVYKNPYMAMEENEGIPARKYQLPCGVGRFFMVESGWCIVHFR